ncbi:TonB-dependent receptor [Persicimonas caeni]|uniref:TonB-dependent receptor n=1 Tax=Persicimonas caeni TaxID=2292766 RepID=A0A4Y6PYI0_PERCE|nr:TonB-dependent receptor [Persicimonas caeni]QDG53067.1 TonB-dependent receptor [Persicimonas caeni]QED34289.1 TonB-dependent receptor [Persicimonas caeni]
MNATQYRRILSIALLAGSLAAPAGLVAQEASDEAGEEDVFIVVPEEGEEGEEVDDDEDAGLADEAEEESREVLVEEVDDDAVRLEDVEVRAERIQNVGGVAHELDEEELERLEYDDPHAVLLQVPGVYVRPEEGFGLRPNIGMRGANAERSKKVALMEDGVLFGPAPYAAPAAYYFPIINRMVGVEVFKGPAAIQYGPNTIGGAINWQTRDIPRDGQTGGIDVNAGSYFTGKAHGYYGASSDWGGFLLEGVHWQSDGFKELDGGGDTGFNRQEIMAKGSLNTDRSKSVVHELTLKAGYSREHSNETYLGLTDEDFEANPLRRYPASQLDEMDWDRTQLELRYRLAVDTSFDVDVAAYRHDFQRTWFKLNGFVDPTPLQEILDSPDSGRRAVLYDVLTGRQDSTVEGETLLVGANAREFVSQGIQAIAQHRSYGDGWYNQLETGVRLHNDWIERNHTEDQFLMRSGDLVSNDAPTATTTRNRGEALALAAHVLDEFFIADFTFTPGLRFEYILTDFTNRLTDETTDNTQSILIPGLGVHYALTEKLGVLAGAYRGFSPVSPGQPDGVEPETSVNYEAGVRFADEKTGTLLEAIGFFNDYGNLIGECSFSVGCDEQLVDRQFNAGDVHVWGAELVAAHTFALGGDWFLPGRLAYTFTESDFQTSFTSGNPQFGEVEEGDELPYVPTHQASVQLGVTDQTFALNTRLTYVGQMLEEAGKADDEDVRTTERYALIDLLASYEFFDGFKAYGKVSNVLGTQAIASRRPYGARPLAPFMARLGLKYDFE